MPLIELLTEPAGADRQAERIDQHAAALDWVLGAITERRTELIATRDALLSGEGGLTIGGSDG